MNAKPVTQAGKLGVIEDKIYTKSKKIGAAKHVREKYIRNDISCRIRGCKHCVSYSQLSKSASLDLTQHELLILGVDVASRYISCLDWPELTYLVIAQTVIDALDCRNRTRSIRKLQAIVADTNKNSVYFPNTLFQPTLTTKVTNETSTDCDERAIRNLALWYRNHIDPKFQVTVLCNNIPLKYDKDINSVHYKTFEEYVRSNLPLRYQEFQSVQAATKDSDIDISETTLEEYAKKKASKVDTFNHSKYLSTPEIEEGLRNKTLLQGVIKYKKFVTNLNDRTATVSLSSQDSDPMWLIGSSCINRATDGDLVVVKVLSKAEVSSMEIFSSLSGMINSKEVDLVEAADDLEEPGAGDEITEAEYVNPISGYQSLIYCKVVGITNRNWRPIVATIQLEDRNANNHLVIPLDMNIPKINIHHSSARDIENYRIVVVIDDWQIGSRYPDGHFIRSLGKIGDMETEIDALLVEHQIASSQSDLYFSEKVLSEMPQISDKNQWQPDFTQKDRRDIRKKIIFSIDPVGSKDIDDAISFEKSVNPKTGIEGYELGVHIADVTAFIRPGSAADIEARKRGTTIYLADRRFNMVPEILSENLCSLRANQDRYAVSVIWKLDADYTVKSVWFGKTLINSSCEMSYESAQLILNNYSKNKKDNPKIGEEYSLDTTLANKLGPRICDLAQAMKTIRARRMKNGALELENNEMKFVFNENKSISSIKPKQKLEIHSVIEEAMVMANCEVAKHILKHFSNSAMLRIHVDPISDRFESIKELAKLKGFNISTSSNLELSNSLAKIDKAMAQKNPTFILFLKSMTVLALSEANYVSSGVIPSSRGFKHYGLAVDAYTHFTSPIRRYADIVVHRQLIQSLSESSHEAYSYTTGEKPAQSGIFTSSGVNVVDLKSQSEIEKVADHLNIKNRKSKIVQRASTALFQTKYFMDLFGKFSSGDASFIKTSTITGICTNGFKSNVADLGISGTVSFQKMRLLGSTLKDYIMLPLSLLTFSPQDVFKFIPFCRVSDATKTSIQVELPSLQLLKQNSKSDSILTNSETNFVSLDSYPVYLEQYNKLCGEQGRNKKSLNADGSKSVVLSFKVFDEALVLINIRTPEFHLPEIVFSLVQKPSTIFQHSSLKQLPPHVIDLGDLGIGKTSTPPSFDSSTGILGHKNEVLGCAKLGHTGKAAIVSPQPAEATLLKPKPDLGLDANLNVNPKVKMKPKSKLKPKLKSKPNSGVVDDLDSIYSVLDKFRQLAIAEYIIE